MVKTEGKSFKHYTGLIDTTMDQSTAIQAELDIRGWSIVVIEKISAGPVVIAYDCLMPGIPSGYAIYTAPELERIDKISDRHTIALVHAAKLMGAELITDRRSDD